MCSKHYPALGVLTVLGPMPTPLVSPDPYLWITHLPRKSLITQLTPCFITRFTLGSSSPRRCSPATPRCRGLQEGTPGSLHHCGCSGSGGGVLMN